MKSPSKITTQIIMLLFASFSSVAHSQNNDGYWLTERIFPIERVLSAGEKTYVRVDLPVGTTEVFYRVSVLDETSKITTPLVSILANSNNPYAVGTGTILGLSTTFGSDKCYFTIFSTEQDAVNYYNYGTYQTGCYINPTTTNLFADRITKNDTRCYCLKNLPTAIWFGFKSANMITRQKVVLEVVPWVDSKASKGWSLEVKNTFMTKCMSAMSSLRESTDIESLCDCVLQRFQANHRFQDFDEMTMTEINKLYEVYGKECFVSK